MYNFNKKQKIILGILAIIVILGICYYVYAKDEDFSSIEELQVEESIQESSKEETEKTIIVHISGAVKQEGIVELKVNSRVADAIEKAGGLKDDANTNTINLAYVLEDGMKIYIPNREETEEQQTITKESGVVKENAIQEKLQTNIQKVKNNTKKVNINTAFQTELETLPGIGPSTASKIMTYRKENGNFKTIEDIKEVNGIGESKFNNIKDLITVK